MISLARVGVRHGQTYYRRDNYYTRSNHVENSAWFGQGAAELSLFGMVDGEAFTRLLEGRAPDGTTLLKTRAEGHSGKQRAGIDMTFSAPKSVSLAALVAGDGRVEAAHRRAVEQALKIAEERYSMTRSGGHQYRRSEVAGNLIVAQFHHDTSRAKDPQLHTHCVAINAVKRADGEWRSLLNDGLFANAKLLGLIYKNELAREVQAIGYKVAVKGDGTFEIQGYSEDQLRAFSKRRQQILEQGGHTPQQAREVVKKHRPTKGKELPREQMQERWREEASAYGITHPLNSEREVRREQAVDYAECVAAASRHATERDVSFRREDLERFALETNLGRLDYGKLNEQVEQSAKRLDIIAHQPGYFTTREAIATEARILSVLEQGRGQMQAIASAVPRRILDNSVGLTQGQKVALETSLLSRDRFIAWQGVAGAGKTFAMNELRSIAEVQGFKVRGLAPSAEAAKVLEVEGKIESNTVTGLLASKAKLSRHDRELWIVDEAGLLAARDAANLMERAQDQGARVIFVGDTRQLSSVEAGNPFKLLQQHGIVTAHLTESRRQKTEALKLAAAEMAQGQVRSGLRILDKDIIEFRREYTRVQHVANDYLSLDADERSKTLVLAGTNRERELITTAVREGLQAQGRLGPAVTIQTLRAKDLTRDEVLAAKFGAGDVMVFHKAYQRLGIERGQQMEVTSVDAQVRRVHVRRSNGEELTIQIGRTPGFQVFEVKERLIAQGDQIRWTRNDRELRLRNGQDLRVEGVQGGQILLTARDGRRLELSQQGRLHLDYSYVSTVYASQGKTCERVIISADKTFGREAMYVAVTRAKSSVTLYTQDKERMCQLAEVSRAKVSARDLVREAALAHDVKKGLKFEQGKGLGTSRGRPR